MLHWTLSESGDDIVITCAGNDKLRTWPAAVVAYEELIARRSRPARVLVDLRQMTGYETEARRAWQNAFRRHRQQMLSLVCVGGSPLIRMGAAVVGAVAGVPIRFVDEWPQVDRP